MMIENKKKAIQLNKRAFLNSLVRDFSRESFIETNQTQLTIKALGKVITIPFEKYSLTGNHLYSDEIFFNGEKISFFKLLDIICDNVFKSSDEFKSFVSNSIENIELYLDHKKSCEATYIGSEQSLLAGHPFHPYPKARAGMERDDLLLYSPECNTSIFLVWYKIEKNRIGSNLQVSELLKKISELKSFEGIEDDETNSTYMPIHPWQWDNFLKTNKDLVSGEFKLGKNKWSILSSMRSLYHPQAPMLVKFSLSLRMTNSIRHLQPNEAIRGNQIKEFFDKENLSEKIKGFEILHEPFYMSLLDEENRETPAFTVQFRENFKQSDNDYFLLSTLVEKGLRKSNDPIIVRDWFQAFLDNVLTSFLTLSCEYDVLLGAHMQNIIIELKNGLPSKAIYRDCQGTGFTLKGYEKYHQNYNFIDPDNGNVLNASDIQKVYGYYLIVNTCFGVISSLSNYEKEEERKLLTYLRNFLVAFAQNYPQDEFLAYLIHSPTLWQKGNFRCCIQNLNENTIEKPWAIYNEMNNPLVSEVRELSFDNQSGVLYTAKLSSGKILSFERLELEKHLEIFHKWHHQDYISEFWELNQSKDDLKIYIEKLYASPFQVPYILAVDGEPVGYYEVYWAYDDRIAPYAHPGQFDRGIHLLIGNTKYLKTRIAYDSIFHISKFLFELDSRTQNVWGEPRVDNKVILKLAHQLPGWEFIKEFDFPHKRSNLLRCNREKFYREMPHEE